MPTRRSFLQSTAAVAAALSGASALEAHGHPLAGNGSATEATSPKPVAAAQVPRMKFFDTEISRMVLGVNPFCGYAHYNNNFSGAMKDWYTPERVCAVMHESTRYGINAFNYVALERLPQDWLRFVSEGGKMHLIMQVLSDDEDTARLAKALKPLAMFRQGEVTDIAYRSGTMNTVREWCKKVRDMGIIVGVGTHKPEVISQVEDEGWDVDFYAGCVYNRTRTREEWKKVLNGEIMEMENEIYVQSDPPRMYSVMRQTTKPCFAFKVLAAGRIADGGIEQAFRTAFSSIKPNDGILVGMFPRAKDEIRENAEIVRRILLG
ncbi:MAG TPA: hypothetical protein VFA67_16975 [Candidatus Sulfotelmatobacter sp.]|nr:hypothetical protein [Candidatus Sulfotelmatobacter sp.]